MESSQATNNVVKGPKKPYPLPCFNRDVVREVLLPAIKKLEVPLTGFVMDTKIPADGMLVGIAVEFLGLGNPTVKEFETKLKEFLSMETIAT